MVNKIIVDSCCDTTQELREQLRLEVVPLTLRLGQTEYIDDENLDLTQFREDMKNCTDKVGSASPSPYAYKKAIESEGQSFVVTLSKKLSGSYNSAILGKSMAEEKKDIQTHIFDSKSASAGEVLVAMKIRELIDGGSSKENIINIVESFIDNMKTYFVLKNYDNLQKNGRLGKITGKIINILNIKMVMGSDGDGDISVFAKVRGIPKTLESLIQLIIKSNKKTEGERAVISHCNNIELATQLQQRMEKEFSFKEILTVPTGGVSSLYADDGGVVLAF